MLIYLVVSSSTRKKSLDQTATKISQLVFAKKQDRFFPVSAENPNNKLLVKKTSVFDLQAYGRSFPSCL